MTVSIALAAYNGEAYLREQLDSILSQTFHEFELIICVENMEIMYSKLDEERLYKLPEECNVKY